MSQMVTASPIQVRNWFGSIVSSPAVVVYPRNADEIVEIMRDHERFPGPVRAVGSNHYVPITRLRDALLNGFYRLVSIVLSTLIRGQNTVPTDQQIRYPEMGYGEDSRYTFSIWAFPEEEYIDSLRAYFHFCQEYYRTKGYRFDITSVGYRIQHDTRSLFSYSFNGPVMTFDPVSTGNPGWEDFLRAYNNFCTQHHGTPLFNQTNLLTREQVQIAFGDRIQKFESYRKQFDLDNRLVNPYFRELLGSGEYKEQG